MSIFGILLSAAFCVALFVERILDIQHHAETTVFSRYDAIALTIVLVGFTTVLFQIAPPRDLAGAVPWKPLDSGAIVHAAKALVAAYLPIFNFQLAYWNSLLLIEAPLVYMAAPVVVIMAIMICAILSKTPAALAFYMSSTIVLLAVLCTIYPASMRHYGFLFISAIASYWIAPSCTHLTRNKHDSQLSSFSKRHLR
jgi:hypothetical protein